jgi:hypothetical protein
MAGQTRPAQALQNDVRDLRNSCASNTASQRTLWLTGLVQQRLQPVQGCGILMSLFSPRRTSKYKVPTYAAAHADRADPARLPRSPVSTAISER